MTTKTIEVKADLQNLMLQATKEMGSMGIAMGFQVADTYIKRIATRALELEDDTLLEALEGIGYITKGEES